MCAVSMIHDYMKQVHPVTDPFWTKPKLEGYEEIIKKLQEIDDKLKLEPCDPQKAKFVEEVRNRLDNIEKQLGINDAK